MSKAERQTAQSRAGYHRIAAFMACPQKFAYREILGLQPKIEAEGTGRGTVLHESARAWRTYQDWEDVVDHLDPRYLPYAEQGKDLWRGYMEHYGDERENVLDVEREYEVGIGGRLFTRRVDLTVSEFRGQSKVVIFRDLKTAARMGERARGASADWSLATQELVGRKLAKEIYGLPWGGFELDLVQSDGAAFKRMAVPFKERVLAAIPRSILYFYKCEEALRGTNPWSYPRSGACFDQYGRCDYKPLCDHGKAALAEYEGR